MLAFNSSRFVALLVALTLAFGSCSTRKDNHSFSE